MAGVPWRAADNGISLNVRLTPKGGRDSLDGVETLASGQTVVKARVRAAPEDGAANQALIGIIASIFDVAKRDAALTAGHKSRLKTVFIQGKVEDLMLKARQLFPVLALVCGGLYSAPALAQQDLDDMIRSLTCVDKRSYYETGVAIVRGQSKSQMGQQMRTYRLALELALEGCKGPDSFLVKRSVGMINALNRQIGIAQIVMPSFIKD